MINCQRTTEMFDRIKDIIFKIKDYDRLAHDYSLCLCYFTNNRLSKTTYEIKGLETIILDTIGGYQEEGYKHGIEDAVRVLESRLSDILGDAQPAPVLRAELRELISKIKEEGQ